MLGLFAIAITLSGASAFGSESLTVRAADLTRRVEAVGADKTLGMLLKDPEKWASVQKKITAGTSDWIHVASLLYRHADGAAREELAYSLAGALVHSPGEILLASKISGISIADICLGPDVDNNAYNSYNSATRELKLRVAAVTAVAEPALRDERDKCLVSLRQARAGLDKFFGREE
jgi:hypothetical protein